MPDNVDKLYDALQADGAVKMGRDQFRKKLEDPANRKQLYDALRADGAVKGDQASFEGHLGYGTTQSENPASQQGGNGGSPAATPGEVPNAVRQQDAAARGSSPSGGGGRSRESAPRRGIGAAAQESGGVVNPGSMLAAGQLGAVGSVPQQPQAQGKPQAQSQPQSKPQEPAKPEPTSNPSGAKDAGRLGAAAGGDWNPHVVVGDLTPVYPRKTDENGNQYTVAAHGNYVYRLYDDKSVAKFDGKTGNIVSFTHPNGDTQVYDENGTSRMIESFHVPHLGDEANLVYWGHNPNKAWPVQNREMWLYGRQNGSSLPHVSNNYASMSSGELHSELRRIEQMPVTPENASLYRDALFELLAKEYGFSNYAEAKRNPGRFDYERLKDYVASEYPCAYTQAMLNGTLQVPDHILSSGIFSGRISQMADQKSRDFLANTHQEGSYYVNRVLGDEGSDLYNTFITMCLAKAKATGVGVDTIIRSEMALLNYNFDDKVEADVNRRLDESLESIPEWLKFANYGLGKGIIGGVTQWALGNLMNPNDYRFHQMQMQRYGGQLGGWEEFGADVLGLASDAPLYSLTGGGIGSLMGEGALRVAGGRILHSAATMGTIGLLGQGVSDLQRGEFSGVDAWLSTGTRSIIGGALLGVGGEAARAIAVRPTNLGRVLLNKVSSYGTETLAFTLPDWVEAVYSGHTAENEPLSWEYMYTSALKNLGIVVSLKGRHNFEGWKPTISSSQLSQLQQSYPEFYDAVVHNLDRIAHGQPIDPLEGRALEQANQLNVDMSTHGKGVTWDAYRNAMHCCGYEVAVPAASSVRVNGTTVQVLDAGGNVITEKRCSGTRAAKDEAAALEKSIEHGEEARNGMRYMAGRNAMVQYEACAELADRYSENKEWRKRDEYGVFMVDENGDYIADENYRCTTPDDISERVAKAQNTPAEDRTPEQRQLLLEYEQLCREVASKIPDADALAQQVCEQYGITIEQLQAAAMKDPKSRDSRSAATKAMATYNNLLSRGALSLRPVGEVVLKRGNGTEVVQVYNEANLRNSQDIFFYRDGDGRMQTLSTQDVKSYSPITDARQQRFDVSDRNAAASQANAMQGLEQYYKTADRSKLDADINVILDRYNLDLDENENVIPRGEAENVQDGETYEKDMMVLSTLLRVRNWRRGQEDVGESDVQKAQSFVDANFKDDDPFVSKSDVAAYLIEHPERLQEVLATADEMKAHIKELMSEGKLKPGDASTRLSQYITEPEKSMEEVDQYAESLSVEESSGEGNPDEDIVKAHIDKAEADKAEAEQSLQELQAQVQELQKEIAELNRRGASKEEINEKVASLQECLNQIELIKDGLDIDNENIARYNEMISKLEEGSGENEADVALPAEAPEHGGGTDQQGDVNGDVNAAPAAQYKTTPIDETVTIEGTNNLPAPKTDKTESIEVGGRYQVVDGEGTHEIEVLRDNGNGTLEVRVDGEQHTMPLDILQQMLGIGSGEVNGESAEPLPQQDVTDDNAGVNAPGQVPGNAGEEVNDNMNATDVAQNETTPTVEPGNAGAVSQSVQAPGATNDMVDVPAQTATVTPESMPMREVGTGKNRETEPDWLAVSPERGREWLFNESGLDNADANEIVNNNLEAAQKAVEKTNKLKPRKTTNPFTLQAERDRINNEQSAANNMLDYWKRVKAIQQERQAQAAADRKAKDAEVLAQARAEEAQRQAEELAKQQEQAERGAGAVHPAIAEKWGKAPKVEGYDNEITLANGDKIQGRYVLTESGAATPSHNALREFEKSEGFPVDENGNTVNDRDYERDKDAQNITRKMGDTYDGRAIQQVPVVSKDGVVLSGNGRTMAGELAASNNTDGAYIEHLKKYGKQFGFSPEQVSSMQHPRVVFVPDADMPYTTDTFAKFNEQEMKGQSKTEQAVKLGKVVDDATFNQIVRSINDHETLGDFYNNTRAATEAINALRRAGALNEMQYAEMFDGDAVSGTGRQIIENMLIGKAFEGNPDVIRQLTEIKSLRQSVVTALNEITINKALGKEYSLEKELAQAVDLAYKARKAGYKENEPVSPYATQLNLFPFEDGETVADYNNVAVLELADLMNDKRPTQLKKKLQDYNQQSAESAAGQMDIFAGGVKEKKEIIKTVLNTLHNGETEEASRPEQRGSVADERGGEASLQENGAADTGSAALATPQTEQSIDAAIVEASKATNTEPTDAQKEAGNYKKGHVKIDGFDISIEQPKGSVRSGVDDSGKPWSQTMNNTYGYIRGTEGVDGDHIDVFLSDNLDGWNGTVYVVDQVEKGGIFDEHKVMYGFNSEEEARKAYLSNYEDGWQGLGAITAVSKDEFKKWIGSSHRKTKPFAEYKNVKVEDLNATSVAQHKRMQMEIINHTNPMTDDVHTGIRNESDILTLEEAVEESLKEGERGGWATLSSYPDVPNEVLEEALRSGKIRVYSSDLIEDGVFVTPSRMQAEDYAGGDGSKVYEKEVPIEDVAWINTDEGQLARVRNAGDRGVVKEDAVKYETASRNTGRDIALDDRVSQREYLLSDNYVANLTGKEFAKSDTPLTERVAQFYTEKYGGKVEREGVGTVLLDERSVKDSIAHGIGRNKAVAFAAVPDIIKNGAIIDRQDNWKGRGYGSVTFAAPLEIGGKGYVGIVVANEVTLSDGSHRFYLHEVALQKNLLSEEFKTGIDTGSKQGENLHEESIKTDTKADSHQGDVAKILKEIVTAKESGEKVANERGSSYRSGSGDVIRFESHAEQLSLFGGGQADAVRQPTEQGATGALSPGGHTPPAPLYLRGGANGERAKRVKEMSDAELLKEMQRDIAEFEKLGRGDWGIQTACTDEYDRRHIKDYNAECERVRTMLEENNVSIEEAEDMLCNAIYSWRDGYATADRSRLLAQFDTLNDYYAELEERGTRNEERDEDEAAAMQPPTEQTADKTGILPPAPSTLEGEKSQKPKRAGGFDPSAIKLRKLKSGETCYVERRYQESGGFDFTGSEKVESDADLAYIFRNLENSAIENTFLVLIKNGKATILHTGMGSYAASVGHVGAGLLAASKLKPDHVIFVHNHPSGRLEPSVQDVAMQTRAKKMFGEGVVREAIIIDITSGEYCTFDDGPYNDTEVKKRPTEVENEIPYKTYSFSQYVFDKDYKPGTTMQITDTNEAAAFISSHRLGERDKLSLIVINRAGHVTGNVFLPWTNLDNVDITKAANKIATYIHQMGGESGIIYGSGTIDRSKLGALSREIERREVRLDDFINVEGVSAQVQGVLEEGVEYQPTAGNTGLLSGDKPYSPVGTPGRTEAVQRDLDQLQEKYNSAPVHLLDETMSIEDIRNLRENQLDPVSEEDLQWVYNEWLNGEAVAVTLPVSREIVIFAHKVNNLRELERALFHENYHEWLIGEYGEEGAREICEHFLDAARDVYPELWQDVEANYREDAQAEEFMTYMVEYSMLRGELEDNVYRYLMPVDREIIDKFLNKIGYDRGQEEPWRKERVLGRQSRKARRSRRKDSQEDRRERGGVLWEERQRTLARKGDQVGQYQGQAPQENRRSRGGVLWEERQSLGFAGEEEVGYGEVDDSGISDEELAGYDAGRYSFAESITQGLVDLATKNANDQQLRMNAMREFGGNLRKLQRLMSKQRAYDKATVDDIVRLTRMVMGNGFFKDMRASEVKRLLAAIKKGVGVEDLTPIANNVVDMLVQHQLRESKAMLHKLMQVRGRKVDARGVEVQAGLDIDGQRMMSALKDGMSLGENGLLTRINDCENRLGSEDEVIRKNAMSEYQGLMLAKEYHDNILSGEEEEIVLRNEKRQEQEKIYDFRREPVLDDDGNAVLRLDGEPRTIERKTLKPQFKNNVTDENKQERKRVESTIAAIEKAIRDNRMERVTSYIDFMSDVAGDVRASRERAAAWRAEQLKRVEEIHHNANSDLKGVDTRTQNRERKYIPLFNPKNALVRGFLQPLATFEKFMRYFGRSFTFGEGYLFELFQRGLIDCGDKEWRIKRALHEKLDKKVSELFGVTYYSDLYGIARDKDHPSLKISIWDNGVISEQEIYQDEAAVLYAWSRQQDTEAGFRRMGISEEDMETIKSHLDPKFLKLANWLIDEFYPSFRKELNEVHERMFGAPMAAVDNYFPVVRNEADVKTKEKDISERRVSEKLASVIIKSIIKRTRNAAPLDIHTSIIDLVLSDIEEKAKFIAWTEFYRDLNTLLNYKTFEHKVKNMSSMEFGAGEDLWKSFEECCAILTGVYDHHGGKADEIAVNISKGFTAGAIAFRPNTALKQLLSLSAFWSDASIENIVKYQTRPFPAWKWAMENLPGFAERWQSRQAGDTRLMDTDVDWKLWRNKYMEAINRMGMTPNAFIDAVTVASGARAVYETKKTRYLEIGYDEERAEKRALQDAANSYESSQQSKNKAYVSVMQIKRTVWAAMRTMFRNASMSYGRRLTTSLRELKKRMTPGYKSENIEAEAKKLMRDGIPEDNAWKEARRRYRFAGLHSLFNIFNFGWLTPFLWAPIGAYIWYLLAGGDDEEKEEILKDGVYRTPFYFVEGLTGGNIISDVGTNVMKYCFSEDNDGALDFLRNNNLFSSPIESEMEHFLRDLYKMDETAIWWDVFSLAVQTNLGFKPETFTDGVTAIVDCCDADPETSKEALLLIARVLQVPRSQVDKIYFDELGMTARDAQKLNAMEMAERYARYKRRRSNPLSYLVHSDKDDEMVKKYRDQFLDNMQERMEHMDDEQLEWNFVEGDAASKKAVTKTYFKARGIEDGYSSGSSGEYAHIYSDSRLYSDMAEDALLQLAKTQAENRGDKEQLKAIDYIKSEILTPVLSGKKTGKGKMRDATLEKLGRYAVLTEKLRNEKRRRENAEGLKGMTGDKDSDEKVLRLYRELRKELLRELGIIQ